MQQPKPDTYVRIKWLDSVEDEGWVSREKALEDEHHPIISVGILLSRPTKTDPYYTICRDYGESIDRVCGVMRIPKGAVIGTVDEMDLFDL